MAAAGSFDDAAGEQDFDVVQAALERAANNAAQAVQALVPATKQVICVHVCVCVCG
jgi:hypothetical protein